MFCALVHATNEDIQYNIQIHTAFFANKNLPRSKLCTTPHNVIQWIRNIIIWANGNKIVVGLRTTLSSKRVHVQSLSGRQFISVLVFIQSLVYAV